MSVASLTSTAADRDAGKETKARVDTLVSFLPTEIVSAYLLIGGAIVSAITPGNAREGLRWSMFWLFFALTEVAVFTGWRAKTTNAGTSRKRKFPAVEMLGASVAFVAWATAVPGSPFRAWKEFEDVYFVIVPIIAIVMLGFLVPPARRAIS